MTLFLSFNIWIFSFLQYDFSPISCFNEITFVSSLASLISVQITSILYSYFQPYFKSSTFTIPDYDKWYNLSLFSLTFWVVLYTDKEVDVSFLIVPSSTPLFPLSGFLLTSLSNVQVTVVTFSVLFEKDI